MNVPASVVIPAYNSENYIHKTIDCAKRQTYPNFEIIIIDDGSTDKTYEVASNVAGADPRVRIFRQSNQRVGAARNLGLRQAAGRFVAFLDSDDLWHPTALQKHMDVLLKEPKGGASFCLHRGIDVHDRILYSETYWPVDQFELNAHIVMQPVRNGSSLVVDRDLALAVGGFITQYRSCEDLDFELKIAARSPIRVVHEYLVGYRRSDESMSSNKQHMIEGIIGVTTQHLAANPTLPGETRRWALGRMHEDVAYNALIGGDWKTVVRHTLLLARNDPVSFSCRLAEKLHAMLAIRFHQNRSYGALENEDFLSADPAYIAPESTLDWLRWRRLLQLIAHNPVSRTI